MGHQLRVTKLFLLKRIHCNLAVSTTQSIGCFPIKAMITFKIQYPVNTSNFTSLACFAAPYVLTQSLEQQKH